MARRNGDSQKLKEAPLTLKGHSFYGLKLDEQQEAFRDAIWDKSKLIVYCNSKSGTGKTTIAAGVANLLVQYGLYEGITYIASPTQEQKQGYLKGTLEEKSEPYFTPFYQALSKINVNISTALVDDVLNMKNGTGYITCATHTFLRGITYENQVIILDECQNFGVEDLRKVLTRISDNCKTIVIGHSGQVDMEYNQKSGFLGYLEHFRGDERVAVCELTKNYRGWVSSRADEYCKESPKWQ